jgi:histone acetyltransferase (RNA polymerase elongator complex component)
MASFKHIIIPVFLNNSGCPSGGRCVFCNQAASGGQPCPPDSLEPYLKKYICDINKLNINNIEYTFEIAFYGGTFTALELELQSRYFSAARAAAENETAGGNKFTGFRVATRPDYISTDILSFLRDNEVKTIEIGVESFDGAVLEAAGRGYRPAAAIESIKLIKSRGFKLSLHLMCGLIGQSRDIFKKDAGILISLAPDYARIHPLCVIKGSKLGDMYKENKFIPRPDAELIEETAYAMALFELNGIKVIRAGILENDNFRKEVLAGPAYPNLREIAESYIHGAVYDYIREKFERGRKVLISAGCEKTLNYLIGYKKINIKKNNDLYLEFKNKMLYNNERIYYILISAENNELTYALTRPDVLKQYIIKF